MIRAVFFDLDDTLCDAATAFQAGRAAAFARLCARHPALTNHEVERAWAGVRETLFRELDAGRLTMAEVRLRRFRATLRALGIADDAFADQLDLLLGTTQLAHLALFPDATVLDVLRGGPHVGIITNGAGDAHPDSQRSKAAHLGLLDRVDSFWVSDEMGYRKPDPRAFQPALNAVGLAPAGCLYVGDAPASDIVGANRAGLRSVLVWRAPSEPPPGAGDERPAAIVHTLSELPALIARIDGGR